MAAPGLTDLERRCVSPFYLKMTGLNAINYDIPFGTLREVARQTIDGEVAELLASHWRPRVMGAWLASGRALAPGGCPSGKPGDLARVADCLALATVALHELGAKAVPSLRTYLQLDLERERGSASFVAAAPERLDAVPVGVTINGQHRGHVDGMLGVTHRLAGAGPGDGLVAVG